MAVRLEITEPGGEHRRVSIGRPIAVVGRSARCDVHIASDVVSSKHVRLRFYRDGTTLEDLNSTNGTFVNGARVDNAVEIAPGDSVQLGHDGPVIRLVGAAGHGPAVASHEAAGVSSGREGSNDAQDGVSGTWSRSTVAVVVGVVAVLSLSFVICGVGGIFAGLWGLSEGEPDPVAGSGQNGGGARQSNSGGRSTRDIARARQSAAGGSAVDDAGPPQAGAIVSVYDEDNVRQAVGMVIRGAQITAQGSTKELPYSTGTAFAISPDGYLITNKHVVEIGKETLDLEQKVGIKPDQRRVWVVFCDRKYEADVVHVSQDHDLSILKINRQKMPYFFLASDDAVPRMTDVVALGFPGAAQEAISESEGIEASIRSKTLHTDVRDDFLDSAFDYVSTTGKVSKMRTETRGRVWIQHNADISHGNSGGPLCLEYDATVVGINTIGVVADVAQGMFYSLSLSQLRDEVSQHVPHARWRSL